MTSISEISNQNEEDYTVLLRAFPNEIWQKVLKNIHLPDDFIMIANSSTTFKHFLLLPHWTRVIFPKILDLLELNCLGYSTQKGKETILNLRLVCSEWKGGVDNFLQNVPEHFMFDAEMNCGRQKNDPRPNKYRVENYHVLRFFQHVTKFRATFDATHLSQNLNPFVNRKFQIFIIIDMRNILEFLQVILNLLRDYGHHVWYFKLGVRLLDDDLPHENSSVFGFGDCIRDILSLLPCLGTLHLTVHPDSNWESYLSPEVWQPEFADMQQYWKRSDMPHFPNLIFLGERGLPFPLLMALLRANPHLLSLESTGLTRAATSAATYETELPKHLKNLSVSFRDIHQLEIFESAKIEWQLSKLCIQARSADYSIQLPRVMRIAEEKFAMTLRKVYVLCRNGILTQEPPLRFPSLEHVHLSVFGLLPELNLLLPMRSTLKTLYIQRAPTYLWARSEQEFLEEKNMTHDPHLWQMFTKLQDFSVVVEHDFDTWRWHNITRDQFEKSMRTCKPD